MFLVDPYANPPVNVLGAGGQVFLKLRRFIPQQVLLYLREWDGPVNQTK